MLKYITTRAMPLYFEVRETRKVVATEESCNIAFEYGDGQLHLVELPQHFPKPGSHSIGNCQRGQSHYSIKFISEIN